MATYTGDSLDKLRKQDLIPIVLTLQSKLEDKDNTVLEEVRNESVSQLRSELGVTKNVNNLLLTRLTTLERQCWANAQYSRRKCLDIMGIPHEVSGEVLEEKVFKILGNLVAIFLLTVLRPAIVSVEQLIQQSLSFQTKGLPARLEC